MRRRAQFWAGCACALGIACSDGDARVVANRDAAVDAGCTDASRVCSKDAARVEEACGDTRRRMLEDCSAAGQLCEDGACVEPWRYGNPVYPDCADDPGATSESLADKAAYYDAIAPRLHVHPDVGLALAVRLKPGVSQSKATWRDVEAWLDDNHFAIWGGMYTASQAYRHAVTRDPVALQNVRVQVRNLARWMKLSGVPGLFMRANHPPGVDGYACPEDPAAYAETPPGATDRQNGFRQIRDDGCYWVTDAKTQAWKKTDHCGLEEFAGFCVVDNVSKDIYSGHLFALGAVYQLVDDPEIRATVRDLAGQVGRHLMDNGLQIIDWDGQRTSFGDLYANVIGVGLNAAVSLGWIKLAVLATGDPELRDFYDNCLLQRDGRRDCIEQDYGRVKSYVEHLKTPWFYSVAPGCSINPSNISIHIVSLHHYVWLETDPEIRAIAQETFDTEVMHPDHSRAAILHRNPFWNFMWAGQKRLGPDSDGPDYDAVEAGMCNLRRFPSSLERREIRVSDRYDVTCQARGDQPATDAPLPVDEQCQSWFTWWNHDAHIVEDCDADPSFVHQPAAYLLPYWMGRYYGFIDSDG